MDECVTDFVRDKIIFIGEFEFTRDIRNILLFLLFIFSKFFFGFPSGWSLDQESAVLSYREMGKGSEVRGLKI